ncbi:MAG TPA: hypothetical protein VFN35_08295 [Ktedonobacteraceae bacterium]|nr:hypothetical protein [Ktedonobacteraceae bacterium]
MRFLCSCGHIIRDQTNSLPCKARFTPDEDTDDDSDHLATILEEFILAREAGKQQEFLASHFAEDYPQDLPLQSIINDLLTREINLSMRVIYECEKCGRIFVEHHPAEARLAIYAPEGETRGVLQSHRHKASS